MGSHSSRRARTSDFADSPSFASFFRFHSGSPMNNYQDRPVKIEAEDLFNLMSAGMSRVTQENRAPETMGRTMFRLLVNKQMQLKLTV
jgi:hypothetical protein